MKSLTVARTTIALSFISILLVAVGLFTGNGSRAESSAQWHLLSELLSSQQVTQMISENTAPGANRAQIASSAVGLRKGDLLAIDFNTSALCGVGGCAIAVYRVSTGERLLFTYVLQPAGQPIVELTQRSGVELACLVIAPASDTPADTTDLARDTLCYRNGEWVTEES